MSSLGEKPLKYDGAAAAHPEGDLLVATPAPPDLFYCDETLSDDEMAAPTPEGAAVARRFRSGSFLVWVVKFLLTCCYRSLESVFDLVTNRWVWNVLLITLYILFDVFFHLVLAASAIMVTIIINIDNVYRKSDEQEDEEEGCDSVHTSCTDIPGGYEKDFQSYHKKT